MAQQSSTLYANNLKHLIAEMGGVDFKLDFNNEIISGACVIHNNIVKWKPPSASPAPISKPQSTEEHKSNGNNIKPGNPSGAKETDSLLNKSSNNKSYTAVDIKDDGHGKITCE
jgi:hypothetical protein